MKLPDPATLTTEELEPYAAEFRRRVGQTGGRPQIVTPCQKCRTPLTARQLRGDCPHCGFRNPRR